MVFTAKKDWKDGDLVPASDMNRIEQGIEDASKPISYADVTGKPALLAIGTTATTAKAGNWTPAIGDIPTGVTATTVALGNHAHTATQITATAVTGGTATNVQGILTELTARIIALETAGT